MDKQTIGVISDTHGVLRPAALQALKGSTLIIHAGDVGSIVVLEQLRAIAPVVAVRGNIDSGAWAEALPKTEFVQFEGNFLHVIHDIDEMEIDPAAAGVSAVIFGHSHRPVITLQNGIIFLNPGSAGPRRFELPVSVASIRVENGSLYPRLMELNVP